MPSKSQQLIQALRDFFAQRKFATAVVGLSGGVDSALTLALAVHALGASNVTGLILPQSGITSSESVALARQLATQLQVRTYEFDVSPAVQALRETPWTGNPVADMNLAPRARMIALYHFALSQKSLVLGTSNRSEILLGYGTKWGDFAADVEVLGSLWKWEVYELAAELGVPPAILDRPPTAELLPGQTDESELGAGYAVLDPILQRLVATDFALPAQADELTRRVWERVQAHRHKTELVPVLTPGVEAK